MWQHWCCVRLLKYQVIFWSIVLAVKSLSCVQLFLTPWTTGCQAPLSMGMGSQRVKHDWVTDLIWSDLDVYRHLTVNISPTGIPIRSPKSAHLAAFHILVDGNSISEVPRTNRCELSLTPHHILTATVLTTETKPEPGHLSSPLLLLPWFMPPSTLT